MEFKWVITANHKKRYQDFIECYKQHPIVKDRISRNIKHEDLDLSKAYFWRTLIGCLLTTQQRSGKGTRISLFLDSNDDLLDVNNCLRAKNLAKLAQKTLSQNGIRRNNRIANEIEYAREWLTSHDWQSIKSQLDIISGHTTVKEERSVANFFRENFIGIGPKQSRNLIQWIGLSKYEIPLDSRIVRVLRKLDFPVPLSSSALSDEKYYCFIEDGIQLIMAEIGIYPCIFDACAFASGERKA
ncbi:MAG: hypothetical protein WC476_06630 [Phycisphaerae bacterium]